MTSFEDWNKTDASHAEARMRCFRYCREGNGLTVVNILLRRQNRKYLPFRKLQPSKETKGFPVLSIHCQRLTVLCSEFCSNLTTRFE
jgi:hypothetical protein